MVPCDPNHKHQVEEFEAKMMAALFNDPNFVNSLGKRKTDWTIQTLKRPKVGLEQVLQHNSFGKISFGSPVNFFASKLNLDEIMCGALEHRYFTFRTNFPYP